MKKFLNAVVVLILMNAVIYFAASLEGGQILNELALYFPENESFSLWQGVTHLFMHGGIFHLLLNMLALWMFGAPLERIWGTKRFLIFYFIAGIGAASVYTLIHYYQFDALYQQLIDSGFNRNDIQNFIDQSLYPTAVFSEKQASEFFGIYQRPMVGASGAIYGILVAFAFTYPDTKLALIFLPVPIAAKYFIPILISIDLFSGLTGFSLFGGGVAYFAHVGGALIGFLLMMYWRITLRDIQ